MRSSLIALATLLLTVPLTAQEPMDADRAIEGGGELAEGWMGRTDGGQNFDNVRFTDVGGVLDISVGPAIVLYKPENMGHGSYTVAGTFEQLSSKGHAHGIGLIVGGADLQGPNQVYTYFLVRGDGNYIIKTRKGAETFELAPWTPHGSIHQSDDSGQAENNMSIEVGPQDAIFKLNGQEVHRHPKAEIYTEGVWGVRLNHNLDMRVKNLKNYPGM
jgi:hypothetical protein